MQDNNIVIGDFNISRQIE